LYKVAWAHPEFGSLIAVACDRLVVIYEEACYGSGRMTQSGWIKRTPTLSDARAAITDLKFAPKYLGLQIVLCAQNGEVEFIMKLIIHYFIFLDLTSFIIKVRIYECTDILSSNVWQLVHPELKTNMSSCSSCSWSTCFNLPILLALGCDEINTNTDKLVLYEYNDTTRTYSRVITQSIICTESIRSIAFAPSIGKIFKTL
jgi:hypothetical protein